MAGLLEIEDSREMEIDDCILANDESLVNIVTGNTFVSVQLVGQNDHQRDVDLATLNDALHDVSDDVFDGVYHRIDDDWEVEGPYVFVHTNECGGNNNADDLETSALTGLYESTKKVTDAIIRQMFACEDDMMNRAVFVRIEGAAIRAK